MARTTNSKTVATTNEVDVDALVERLFAGERSSNVGIATRIAGFFGNRIADSGDLVAEVSAGFKAAGANYAISKETAYQRQMNRTKERVKRYLEQQ